MFCVSASFFDPSKSYDEPLRFVEIYAFDFHKVVFLQLRIWAKCLNTTFGAEDRVQVIGKYVKQTVLCHRCARNGKGTRTSEGRSIKSVLEDSGVASRMSWRLLEEAKDVAARVSWKLLGEVMGLTSNTVLEITGRSEGG